MRAVDEKHDFEKENFDLKVKIFNLEESMKNLTLQTTIPHLDAESAKSEVAKMKLIIEQKDLELEQRNILLSKARDAINALKGEVKLLRQNETKNIEMEQCIQNLRSANGRIEADLRSRIKELENESSSSKQLLSINWSNEKKLLDIEASYSAQNEKFNLLINEKKYVEELLDASKKQVVRLEAEIHDLQNHINIAHVQHDEHVNRIQFLTDEVERTKKEYIHRTEVSKLTEDLERKHRKEIDDLKVQCEEEKNRLRGRIQDLALFDGHDSSSLLKILQRKDEEINSLRGHMQTNPSQTIPNYRFDSSRTYDVKTSPSNSVPIDHFYELKESHWKLEREKVMLTEANRQTEEKLKSLQEKLIKIEQDFHQTLNENTELKSKCSDKNIDTILRENERLKSKYDRQKEEIKSLANRIPNEMKRTFLNNNSNANDENSRPRGNGYDYYTDNTMNDMTLNVTMEACQMCWNALIKWDNVLNTILDGNMFDDLQESKGVLLSRQIHQDNLFHLHNNKENEYYSFQNMKPEQILHQIGVRIEKVNSKVQRTEKLRSLFVNQSEKIIKTYEKINSSSHDKIGVLSQRYHNLMNQFESLKRFIEHNNKQKETDRLEMKKFREEISAEYLERSQQTEQKLLQINFSYEKEKELSNQLRTELDHYKSRFHQIEQENITMTQDLEFLNETELIMANLTDKFNAIKAVNENLVQENEQYRRMIQQFQSDYNDVEGMKYDRDQYERVIQQLRHDLNEYSTQFNELLQERDTLLSRQINPELASLIEANEQVLQAAVSNTAGSTMKIHSNQQEKNESKVILFDMSSKFESLLGKSLVIINTIDNHIKQYYMAPTMHLPSPHDHTRQREQLLLEISHLSHEIHSLLQQNKNLFDATKMTQTPSNLLNMSTNINSISSVRAPMISPDPYPLTTGGKVQYMDTDRESLTKSWDPSLSRQASSQKLSRQFIGHSEPMTGRYDHTDTRVNSIAKMGAKGVFFPSRSGLKGPLNEAEEFIDDSSNIKNRKSFLYQPISTDKNIQVINSSPHSVPTPSRYVPIQDQSLDQSMSSYNATPNRHGNSNAVQAVKTIQNREKSSRIMSFSQMNHNASDSEIQHIRSSRRNVVTPSHNNVLSVKKDLTKSERVNKLGNELKSLVSKLESFDSTGPSNEYGGQHIESY